MRSLNDYRVTGLSMLRTFWTLTFRDQGVRVLHAKRGRRPGSGFFCMLLRDFLIGKDWGNLRYSAGR